MAMTMFQTQLNTMVMWFDQWSESGQTVALFKMLTRLAPVQARFVSIALEHSLMECAELALREQEANNPGFISGLINERRDSAMMQTLLHLPLLRPGNAEAKHVYLMLIPALLNYTLESGTLIDEARQLLSYVLIHPALREDRKIFEPWRRSLDEKMLGNIKATSAIDAQQKRRSNSLTPPFAITPNAEWTSQDDLSVSGGAKPRRYSLSSEQIVGPPLSPQSSQASSGSGSETHLDLAGNDTPEMRDLKNWLKSLRLHKYFHIFSHLSYEQILSITDANFDSVLESIGGPAVTQGARRKIILSIIKLRERSNLLADLEQDVMHGGHLLTAMDELKQVLITPIKAYHDEDHPPYDDIPSQFTRVLGKICTQLMVGGHWSGNTSGDEHAAYIFLGLLETTLHHEAFTQQQKKKINSWCVQVSQHLRRLQENKNAPLKVMTPPLTVSPRPQIDPLRHRSPIDAQPSSMILPRSTERLDSGISGSETEIDSRLESLCLSMTEHALGSSEPSCGHKVP
ncbi:sterile alpha motif domain containing [Nesidiocoris tenuis]|uniref:Sterile alpha motif domain containing n=1 Tax=Nesidiocoris tenuis TaxID=355587 RepID=A0ABN7B8P8_9HEMI|nr:sterile alpha motif domain containing [Nesidiocoris tenuis]